MWPAGLFGGCSAATMQACMLVSMQACTHCPPSGSSWFRLELGASICCVIAHLLACIHAGLGARAHLLVSRPLSRGRPCVSPHGSGSEKFQGWDPIPGLPLPLPENGKIGQIWSLEGRVLSGTLWEPSGKGLLTCTLFAVMHEMFAKFVTMCMGLHAIRCAGEHTFHAGVHAVRWLHQGPEEIVILSLLFSIIVLHIGGS